MHGEKKKKILPNFMNMHRALVHMLNPHSPPELSASEAGSQHWLWRLPQRSFLEIRMVFQLFPVLGIKPSYGLHALLCPPRIEKSFDLEKKKKSLHISPPRISLPQI